MVLIYFRLASFAQNEEGSGIPSEIQLFDIFSQQISQVIQVIKLREDDNFGFKVLYYSKEHVVLLNHSFLT